MAARSQAETVSDSAFEDMPLETPVGEMSTFPGEAPAESVEGQGPAEGFSVSPASPTAGPLQHAEGAGEEGKL